MRLMRSSKRDTWIELFKPDTYLSILSQKTPIYNEENIECPQIYAPTQCPFGSFLFRPNANSERLAVSFGHEIQCKRTKTSLKKKKMK